LDPASLRTRPVPQSDDLGGPVLPAIGAPTDAAFEAALVQTLTWIVVHVNRTDLAWEGFAMIVDPDEAGHVWLAPSPCHGTAHSPAMFSTMRSRCSKGQ